MKDDTFVSVFIAIFIIIVILLLWNIDQDKDTNRLWEEIQQIKERR